MITILITLIILGVLLYLVNSFIPMDIKIKKLFNIVAIVFICIWLLKVLGLMKYLNL